VSEDENLICNPTYQSRQYRPASGVPLPSNIHSEVGDEERDPGEYEGKEDTAGPKSEGKVGNKYENGHSENGDNDNKADETGNSNWSSSAVAFVLKGQKNSPIPSVKCHALITLPLSCKKLEQERTS
jgi:hypothetical protein